MGAEIRDQEIKVFEDVFQYKEVCLVLEAISDIRHVTHIPRYSNLMKEKDFILKRIVHKLLSYKENREFFEYWGIYEKNISITEEEIELIITVLRIVLEAHPDEYQLNTYVGGSIKSIQDLIEKLESYKER